RQRFPVPLLSNHYRWNHRSPTPFIFISIQYAAVIPIASASNKSPRNHFNVARLHHSMPQSNAPEQCPRGSNAPEGASVFLGSQLFHALQSATATYHGIVV
ncbi:MAG: hypothetical protein ACK5PZ_22115, partial [Pirellula sp.]